MQWFKVVFAGLLIIFGVNLTKAQVKVQNTGKLSGVLVNRKTQQNATGQLVTITPGNEKMISDSNGSFRFTNLLPGAYSIKVSGLGIQDKLLTNVIVTTGNENILTIELEPSVILLNTVTVTGRKNTAKATTLESPLSIQRLTSEDIKANPGGNFDISKVIQSLPGVGGGAAGGTFRNDIIIRGGAPSENVFYLDGIEVPIINHFSTQGSGGGPQGILNVSFIQDVKLSTSAFDARYDNALSSVFQFRQKNGNPNKLQGNFRMSGTEVAATLDGPISKRTTFLASVRRSYLELLFQALDLPIRPNYWDYQFKTTTKINEKTTLTTLGLAAIDDFKLVAPREATPEKLFAINSNPLINQWNYTLGLSLKKLIQDGYWNLSLSRNTLDNQADRYEDNEKPSETTRTFQIRSNETENKFRFDVTKNINNISLSYGLVAQYVQFDNAFYQLFRPALKDSAGKTLQNAVTLNTNTGVNFLRYGGFVQLGTRLLNDRLAISSGLRADANSYSASSQNPLDQLSPRISLSFALSNTLNFSASYGTYYRLPSYTQLAYNNNGFTNPGKYIQSNHYVAGFELLPSSTTRFTFEGFYKGYKNYPVSMLDKISLANKGIEFGAIGNEPIQQDGKGRAYGFEFFAQQKLTEKFFGVFSYTLYWSEFSGVDQKLKPASWDNRHLVSATAGYKLPKNWELGIKFRYQGAAPYTPYNLEQSRLNYLTLGSGVFDYDKVNTLRLKAFHSGDIRLDKKWNYKKTTFDFYIDIQNFYASKSTGSPQYTFKRKDDNSGFQSNNGKPVQLNGSNAIPYFLENAQGTFIPTVGFIIEF
ncbi:MAG: TonB-dependent receptor domain-containing protein [Sediminibacterium sp.]